MRKDLYLIKRINSILENKKKIICYPYGRDAVFVREYLLNRKDIEFIMIDNYKTGEGIYGIDLLENKEYDSWHIIICSGDMKIYSELRNNLYRYVKPDDQRITDLFAFPCDDVALSSYIGAMWDPIRNSCLETAAVEIYLKGLKGAVAECGVFQGDFARVINKVFSDRTLYLIDTYEGFDQRDVENDIVNAYSFDKEGGWKYADIDVIKKRMPYEDKVKIVKGYVPDCLENINDDFSFVSLDMDLYTPTLSALRFFWDHIETGGYIFVHDCENPDYLGSRQAVVDFCAETGIGYVILPDGLGTAAISK